MPPPELTIGPATTQNLVVKFDGGICGGVLVENASDDFPQQKKLENLLPNFAGSSPPISPKTSPTSLWKSVELKLSDPTEITPPPYRETGVAIPLSHCASCGIADYRCYTPTSFLKNGLSQSKDRTNKGGIAGKACL